MATLGSGLKAFLSNRIGTESKAVLLYIPQKVKSSHNFLARLFQIRFHCVFRPKRE